MSLGRIAFKIFLAHWSCNCLTLVCIIYIYIYLYIQFRDSWDYWKYNFYIFNISSSIFFCLFPLFSLYRTPVHECYDLMIFCKSLKFCSVVLHLFSLLSSNWKTFINLSSSLIILFFFKFPNRPLLNEDIYFLM